MTSQLIRSPRFAIALIAALLCFAAVARAGPPLICHAIEIGNAKSLPWTSHNWNLSGGETYDTKNLVRDTLDILGPNIPVLVRMETLRRATLYAGKDPVAAKELLAKLHARATAAESSGHPDALAWFDVGYLAEAYKQWIGQTWMRVSKDEQNPAAGVDGYAFVKKALALRGPSQNGNDAQMEFAAALITLSGPRDAHREHAQKAIAGAKSDPLLAQNLASRFTGPQSETISELLAKNVSSN
ncbi:MAG: hypothetical protein DMG44_10170 [Acidobacteria bacterium]|jgi:hypothetical protein|nr:MAG: hypothetical protein DMG44_10170 [Acidobacteriota bacterium]